MLNFRVKSIMENKMTRKEVLYIVLEIVNDHKAYNNFPDATENSRMADDCGMDSLDIVESAMDIERRLGVCFDDEDYDKIKFDGLAVKDLVDLVCKKLKIPVIDVQKNVKKTVIKPMQPQNPEIGKLRGVDWSKFVGNPVRINDYEIIVRKMQHTRG